MSVTKQIQRHEWERDFDNLVKRHLRGDSRTCRCPSSALAVLGEQPRSRPPRPDGVEIDEGRCPMNVRMMTADPEVLQRAVPSATRPPRCATPTSLLAQIDEPSR